MKYTLLISCLAVVFIIPMRTIAQDKKAIEILDAFKEKTQGYETIQVDFTYTMVNTAENINESFEGILYIKDDSYRLSIAGQLVICNGETTWTYLEDAGEVQINSVEDNDESITPSKLFTSYYDDYKAKYAGEYSRSGKTIHQLELTPLEGKSFSKIILEIDKDTLEAVKFAIYDKSGSTYTYSVTKFSPDIPIGNDKFTFNAKAYPDAEIIDMR